MSIFLLFLDTETTGLNYNLDQIIEIGGVVVSFDPTTLAFEEVSHYDSLVALRQEMDDKITRITGITVEELATASKLTTVQENWANWLEKHKITAIVGHSINFDLQFLQKEGWYLPSEAKIIDTLDLAKIIFPHFNAVNLDFLGDKLDIKQELTVTVGDEAKSLVHRSLYDTRLCYFLFQQIVLYLKNSDFEAKFYQSLQVFLPLPIIFYQKQENPRVCNKPEQSIQETQEKDIIINFAGQEKDISLGEKIQSLNQPSHTQTLLKFLDFGFPARFLLIILQLYVISFYRQNYPTWYLKFHAQGQSLDFNIVDLLLESIDKNKVIDSQEVKTNKKYLLHTFENLIWQIKNIREQQFSLAKLIDYVDIMALVWQYKLDNYQDQFTQKELESQFKLAQNVLASYDFLLVGLRTLWDNNNQFVYNPYTMSTQKGFVADQFSNLLQNIKSLEEANLAGENIVIESLLQKLSQEIQQINFDSREILEFRLLKNTLTINKPIPNFDLNLHFEKLKKQFPNLSIQTYLTPEELSLLLRKTNLDTVLNEINWQYEQAEEVKYVDRENMEKLYTELLALAKESKQPVVILGGINSVLKDSERFLTSSFDPKDYLVLGESGSLTKIGSKLVRDFAGLIVIKTHHLDYLLKLKDCPKFAQVWLINSPFLFVDSYWLNGQKESKEVLQATFKNIYLHSTLNQLCSKTQAPVFFLRGY